MAGEVPVDVVAQHVAVAVARALVARHGAVRALAHPVGVGVVDGAALEQRRDDRVDDELVAARNRLLAELAWLVDTPPRLVAAERFANHLATEFTALLTFLWDPAVDATNWRAEQAIRPAVVTRKVCGGNRTRHGADTQQVLASVVRTAKQRQLDLPPLIATMLRAPHPVVPDAFQRPPPTA